MSRRSGQLAEQTACDYLQQQGLVFLTQNYHCRRGEIDLVMKDADVLVFVEVRARQNDRYGSALESITPTKQSRIIATAQHYLQQKQEQATCRFDVVTLRIHSEKDGQSHQVCEWIRDAFQLS
ncbi:YraN family protein [Methylophaga sp. OBS3]|uniref:YraN family protein n=1 Tax=Methylophaga sp. OBS3 TaxID=2991934 RepID=UPI00225B4BEF|nr:YraN family protein [Methylophaga sp. OBS3]MCX4190349.1 YraN family protein [Methylophaga sp. OBS3]